MIDYNVVEPASPRPGGQWMHLGELARLFLKLGITAFGGPAAHIALMEDQVIRRRGTGSVPPPDRNRCAPDPVRDRPWNGRRRVPT